MDDPYYLHGFTEDTSNPKITRLALINSEGLNAKMFSFALASTTFYYTQYDDENNLLYFMPFWYDGGNDNVLAIFYFDQKNLTLNNYA